MCDNGFANALRNFTMDAAAGDAIRHLTDKGYSPAQIKEMLTFPAPSDYIAKVMWDRLVATKKILTEDPFSAPASPYAYEMVERHDEYGRRSFIQVKKESPGEKHSPKDYILCDYGRRKAEGEIFENDFISALPWPPAPVWVLAGTLDGI